MSGKSPGSAGVPPARCGQDGRAPMLTLKVLSALLGYPQAETLAALDEMAEAVAREKLLPPARTAALLALIESWRSTDLLDLQESYVALFDRGRNLSLHIFEHVHGESRDRGQAMVDLLALYESHGFEIATRELPDYIPLFLEYLSRQPRAEVVSLLQDAMPVLSLLGARLAERDSPYHVLFDALAGIAGEPAGAEHIRSQAAAEGPDATLLHMDEIWEEEAVSFMGNRNTCQKPGAATQPIVVTPARTTQPQA